MQSKHGETWRATIEAILHPIPMLGTARHYLALARLATALEALIMAEQANIAVARITKARVDAFKANPRQLDVIAAGLSELSAKDLSAKLDQLFNDDLNSPRRYFARGGEVSAINIAAARIYAEELARSEAA